MTDRMYASAAEFATALDQMGQAIERDVFDKVIKKVLFDLWSELVKENPKDTGRSSASWMLDTDWSDWQLPPGDYRSAIDGSLEGVVNRLPVAERYVIFNNVEYISYLEDGHSQQAPSGFIANALAALGNHIQAAAQSVWWGSPL